MVEKVRKIYVKDFEVERALRMVRTFTAWVPLKLATQEVVLEVRLPFRVFFSEKHRVAAMYPALLTLPLPQKYNAVIEKSPGIIYIGTSGTTPKEFREAVEKELQWYNIRPTPVVKPVIFPIPSGAATEIVNELKMRRLSGWDSPFDASAYFFIEPNRRIMIYRFRNYRADLFRAFLILYRNLEDVPSLASKIDGRASKGIEEALQIIRLSNSARITL